MRDEGLPRLADGHVAFSPIGALDRTAEWIRESVDEERLSLSETASPPGAGKGAEPDLSPRGVLSKGYLKLLTWDYQRRDLPEVSRPCFPSCRLCAVASGSQIKGERGCDVARFHSIVLPFLFLRFK